MLGPPQLDSGQSSTCKTSHRFPTRAICLVERPQERYEAISNRYRSCLFKLFHDCPIRMPICTLRDKTTVNMFVNGRDPKLTGSITGHLAKWSLCARRAKSTGKAYLRWSDSLISGPTSNFWQLKARVRQRLCDV